MMMKFCCYSLVFLLLAVAVSQVDGYPSGAGACPKGMAAVGGSHLSRTITNGTLEDGGYVFSIGGWSVVSGEHIKTGFNDMTLEGSTEFKGFLIRFQAEADGLALGLGPLEQDDSGSVRLEETFCPPAGAEGITHTNNQPKTEIKGSYDIGDDGGSIMVDVTVVVSNTGEESIFYYSSYELTAGKDDDDEDDGDEETEETTEDASPSTDDGGNTTSAPAPDGGGGPAPAPAPDSSATTMAVSVVMMMATTAGLGFLAVVF